MQDSCHVGTRPSCWLRGAYLERSSPLQEVGLLRNDLLPIAWVLRRLHVRADQPAHIITISTLLLKSILYWASKRAKALSQQVALM